MPNPTQANRRHRAQKPACTGRKPHQSQYPAMQPRTKKPTTTRLSRIWTRRGTAVFSCPPSADRHGSSLLPSDLQQSAAARTVTSAVLPVRMRASAPSRPMPRNTSGLPPTSSPMRNNRSHTSTAVARPMPRTGCRRRR